MSEQVLQALFEELNTMNIEERARIKQKYYFTLYGSSSRLARSAKQDLHKAIEIYDNSRRQL